MAPVLGPLSGIPTHRLLSEFCFFSVSIKLVQSSYRMSMMEVTFLPVHVLLLCGTMVQVVFTSRAASTGKSLKLFSLICWSAASLKS